MVVWERYEPTIYRGQLMASRLYPSGQWAAPQQLQSAHNSRNSIIVTPPGLPLEVVSSDGSFHVGWARTLDLWPDDEDWVWMGHFD